MADPIVEIPIPNVLVKKGQTISINLGVYITDEDTGPGLSDTIVYSLGGAPTGSGLTVNSASGIVSGTFTAADIVAMPFTAVITARRASNGAILNTASIPFTTTEPPDPPIGEAAITYYVNGTTGGDSYNGLSPIVTSGSTGPWGTITRANSVQSHVDGHADIAVAPGDYRNQVWTPQYGGADNDHRVRLRVYGTGVVRILGPSPGWIEFGAWIGVPFISIVRDSPTTYVHFAGELTFGTGSGQAEKNENPWEAGHMGKAMRITSTDVDLDCKVSGVYGWNGIETNGGGYARGRFCIDFDQIGSPYSIDIDPSSENYLGGEDFGDGLVIWRYTDYPEWTLIHGGAFGSYFNHQGHASMWIGNGTGQIRNVSYNNSWADIPTFDASVPDGNRCTGGMSQDAFDVHGVSIICQRNGLPQDGVSIETAELSKLEGTRNGYFDSVFRNGRQQVIHSTIRDGAHWCRQLRMAHCVMDQIRGPLIDLQDYYDLPDDGGGLGPYYDMCWKNILARNVSTGARDVEGISSWVDALAIVQLRNGTSLAATFPNGLIHGLTLQENAGRTWNDFWIGVYGTNELNGEYSVQYLLDNFSWFISNFTLTTDCGLSNAPAASAEASLTNIVGQYIPVGGAAALSIAQGVNLTTVATADTGSGTTLYVSDPSWLPNPAYGNPLFGERSESGFRLHCNGANRRYTAVDYDTGAVTMQTGFSRSDGMAVNLDIASGNVPNRGIRGVL